MPATFEVVTVIAASAETVFDLQLDVDVHAASLRSSSERATTSTGRSALGLGDEVTFTARHFGLPWRMTSRVVELERPHRFVDEQVRGPFRELRHEHLFDPLPGGTRMTDRLTVAAPFGPLGVAVTRLLLVRYLRALLEQRARHLKQVAEHSSPQPISPAGCADAVRLLRLRDAAARWLEGRGVTQWTPGEVALDEIRDQVRRGE